MNAVIVAGVWAGAGVLATIVIRATRLKRLAVVVPLAGAVAALVVPAGPGHSSVVLAQSGLTLDRQALGLLEVTGASLALVLMLAPRLDGRETVTYATVGALATIGLATGSPVVWPVVLLGAVGVIALRWIAAAPSRGTLAAGRVPGMGAATLLAAAPFLPLVGIISGPRPEIAAGLLAAGVTALLALVPLGGWAAGGFSTLRGTEVAPWMLMLAPSVLLVAEKIPAATAAAGDDFGRILLVSGLASALFSGVMATRVAPRQRYGRVFLADLGLAAAAIGSAHPGLALQGALLLVLTHAALAPLLMQGSPASLGRVRRLGWVALSGLPPSPSFWARFVLLQALVQVGPPEAVAALIAAALLAIVAVVTAVSTPRSRDEAKGEAPSKIAASIAWLSVASAFAIGLAPAAAGASVFGL